ncbi:hypothetical protein J43TS9_39540 [Paenibacillus cineris]|nr:hypothetical protein J43TS9_39540 [Paenibacillus cineris]
MLESCGVCADVKQSLSYVNGENVIKMPKTRNSILKISVTLREMKDVIINNSSPTSNFMKPN